MELKSAWLLFALALGLLVLPIWWVIAAVFAALWHEFCHYFAVRLCGGQAISLRVGLTGAVMDVRFISPVHEFFCALAGPLGSLFLLLFVKWLPRTAICAAFQGIYNLMPIYPLDGGRGVRCLSELYFTPQMGDKLCFWLERICLVGIVLLTFFACLKLHLGVAPILIGAGIICRAKIPCKPWRNSVQWEKKLQ